MGSRQRPWSVVEPVVEPVETPTKPCTNLGPSHVSGVLMRRALLLVVLLLTLTLGGPGPASAQDQWTEPQRLANDQTRMLGGVTSSGSGEIFATFTVQGAVEYSRRPTGRWARGDTSLPGSLYLPGRGGVVDDDGNVTMVYAAGGNCPEEGDFDDERRDAHIEAAFRKNGAEEWRLFRLPGQWEGCSVSVPALDVDRRGTVTAVWSGAGTLYATQRRLGRRWTKPVVIGRDARSSLDVVAHGRKVSVVWATGESVRSVTSATFGRWGEGRKVASMPDGKYPRVEHLSVVSTGDGTLLAGWSDMVARQREWYSRVRFATADARGRWREPRTVDRISAVPENFLAVLTAAHGDRAVLAWHKANRYDEAGGPLQVRVRTGGNWSPSELVDGNADLVDSFSLAATDGGVALAWTKGDPGNYLPLASSRRWAGTWRGPHPLSSQAPGWSTPGPAPWVVTYKRNVFTAVFPHGRETWTSDLRPGTAD